MACTNIPPPLFEDKITLNLTFIVNKLTFLTVKLLKTPKIARSHTNVFWDSIFAVLPVHVFFSWHHLCKERCRIKQTLCNIMARKSIAGLPIIQVKGTVKISRRDYSRLPQKSPMTKEWNSPLKYCTCSFFCAQSLVHIKPTSEIWYIKCTLYYQYGVNSVNNNSRGSCNRPYRNITFLRHENMRFWSACSLRSLARIS